MRQKDPLEGLPVFLAVAELLLATEDVAGRSGQPSGPLRLTMPRSAFDGAVAPVLARFRAAYPAVEVEIDIEGRLVDVVGQGFDAGLRYGDVLARDVVAAKLTPGSEALLAAASPSRLLDAGALVQVLPGWSTPMEPLYLYYPDRGRQSAALRAFVGFLRANLSHAKGGATGSQPKKDHGVSTLAGRTR